MMRLLPAGLLAISLASMTFPSTADASSNLSSGIFTEYDPAGSTFRDLGICHFFTGPRGDLGAGRFLMTIGDRHSSDFGELQITGDVTIFASPQTGNVEYRLFPNEPAAAEFFQAVLRRQLATPQALLTLYSLSAAVAETYGANSQDEFDCRVSLTGRLDGVAGGSVPVSLDFGGAGQLTAGIDTQLPAHAGGTQDTDPCPTGQLAPDGLVPSPNRCSTADCLLDFKGYRWWTNFNYRGPSFPDKSYYWNDGLRNAFSPANAFVDGAGLHLTVQSRDLGAGPTPAAGEVVAMFNGDGSEANLGYGKYLVTATVNTASSWNDLDPNVAFGVFTFERVGIGGGTGTTDNPNREIDLAEISRFGYPAGDPACNTSLNPRKECIGNSQFTLQLYDRDPDNWHRYMIAAGVPTVTLVMIWPGANQPVTFRQYDGTYTLSDLPATPANEWTTAATQNKFVPGTACQRFHLNLWMGNFRGASPNPPPKTMPYEVTVTNFAYAPCQGSACSANETRAARRGPGRQ